VAVVISSSSTNIYPCIRVNGSVVAEGTNIDAAGRSGMCMDLIALADAADYIDFTTVGSGSLTGGTEQTYFSITQIA
jgi:hypothetical protein